jgi:hypothetical protein
VSLTFISGLAPDGLSIFEDNSFDVCIYCDVKEHLAKSDGYNLLYQIERISSIKAYLFTANGFVKQPPEPSNRYNAHISDWHISEISKFGWERVTGLSGFKFLFSEYGLPRYSSKLKILHFLLILFSLVSRLIVYKLLKKWAYSFSAIYLKTKPVNSISLKRINN